MDFNPKWSGGSNDPSCTSCNGPITPDQPSIQVNFANDPHGHPRIERAQLHQEMRQAVSARCRKAFNATWFRPF